MATLRNRLERLEFELQFKTWVRFQRWLESLTDQEMQDYIASDGTFPEPFLDPPSGSTWLDNLDRSALMQLWEENQRWAAGRTSADAGFYAEHGHWPDQPCTGRDCRKPAFDESKAKASKPKCESTV
jgi:hypothetical protein